MAYRKRFGSALLSAASLLALTATGPALAEAPPPLEEAEALDTSRPSDADTIYVTGVRIPPAGDWSSLPSLVVTSEDIALSRGFALEDVLNRTPLFAPDQTGTSNLGGEGVSTLNLRALNAASGAPRTLVLLNGRRYAASDEFGRVDVAALPASLVRRIDVVTGGASAAHGADAIAGAVNFILDKEFEGADVRLRYGVTDEADGEEANVSAAFGAPLAGGRGHATLFADYYDRNAVEASERRFASVPLDDQGGGAGFQPFGSSRIPGGLAVGGGRPPIPDPLGRDLNGDGAVDLFPSGLAFEGGAIAPAAGFAPDGAPNPLPSLYNFQDLNYLQIPAERLSVFAMGDFDLSPALTVYGEASFADVRNTQRLAEDANDIPEAGVLSVPLSNPLIADNAVLVDFLQTNYDNGLAGDALAGDGVATIADFRRRMTETGPRRTERDIETTRIVVGGEGELGPAQTIAYDVYYSFSQVNRQDVIEGVTSDSQIQQALFAETDFVTGDVVCVDRSNGCAPLSLFGDGAISADAAQFISPLAEERLRTRQHIVSGVVTAPLDFGGESVTPVVALGAEYRKESAEFRPNEVLQSGELGPGATRGETDGDYDVWSLFSEFRAPIEVGAPLLRSVEVDGSVRVETYSTVGGVLSFGGGAVWTLTDSFQFRTRYQRAVRAPNVGELFSGAAANAPSFTDPCNTDQLGASAAAAGRSVEETADFCASLGVANPAAFAGLPQVIAITEGNPGLTEETARTWTAGFRIAPEVAPGLSLELEYYRIALEDAIDDVDPTTVANLCIQSFDANDPFCQAIVRLPGNGQVLELRRPRLNLGLERREGVDWTAIYHRSLPPLFGVAPEVYAEQIGSFAFRNERRPTRGGDLIDCNGVFGGACSGIADFAQPKWRLANRLRLQWPNVALQSQVRVEGPLRNAFADDFDDLAAPRVGAVAYIDVSARIGLSDRLTASFGADNVFDRSPPILGFGFTGRGGGSDANTDPSLYDVVGRRVFIGLDLAI